MPVPYSKNAKKHPDSQLKLIAISLREYGWRQPIIVDKDDVIIVGHGRWIAYQKYPEGIKEPWIVKADDLTPEQVRGYRLMDNKTNESDWDMALAIEELKELDDLNFDIELAGFDRDLLIEPNEKDDLIPENVETRCKTGDLWQLGRHRLLCGDSTKREDVERLMDGKKADMVFTDPPYGIDLTPKKNYASRKENKKSENYEKIKGDEKEFDISKVFENLDCKKWWIWGADYLYKTIPNFREGNLVVWAKRHSESENKVFGSAFELCWVYPCCKKEIWFVRAINQSSEALHIHPTQKPTELAVRALVKNIKEGNIVVDFFLGSGSTLIAAEKTGRICYGMEIDEHYCDVIIQRWEEYTREKAVKL